MDTKKPRNIIKVIEAIKKETSNPDLIKTLDEIIYNAGFRAPEVQPQSWRELMGALNGAARFNGMTERESKAIGAIIRDEVDVGARD